MWFVGILGVIIAAWIVLVCTADEGVARGNAPTARAEPCVAREGVHRAQSVPRCENNVAHAVESASPRGRANAAPHVMKRVLRTGKAQWQKSKHPGKIGKVAPVRKASKSSLPSGTVCLIDLSNLIGAVGPEHIAFTLRSIAEQLANQGYKAMFFMEHRAYHWAMCNQSSDSEKAEFRKFVNRKDFTLVLGEGGKGQKREADEALLQIAEAVKESVCVSMDRFADYAATHPSIVGTDRIRRFSVTWLDEKKIIAIDGMPRAVVVDFSKMIVHGVDVESENSETEVFLNDAERPMPSAADKVGGDGSVFLEIAERYLKRGDGHNAERMFVKAAKRNPAAYRLLSEMYSAGDAVKADERKARRYDLLADKAEKKKRECHRRYLRLHKSGKDRQSWVCSLGCAA